MRVQAGVEDKGVVVAYYDSNYRLLERRVIPEELPLFGGFHETDEFYFLVTGKQNPKEKKGAEVFRVTKYDKNWNRLGAASLHGANTTVPFNGGSCRMADADGYLVVRTCHRMCKTSEGLNHQSNVTILIDMQSMSILDECTDVLNNDFGYVSHSFNQFVEFDGDRIVSVDHGDAHPRAIALMKYHDGLNGNLTV